MCTERIKVIKKRHQIELIPEFPPNFERGIGGGERGREEKRRQGVKKEQTIKSKKENPKKKKIKADIFARRERLKAKRKKKRVMLPMGYAIHTLELIAPACGFLPLPCFKPSVSPLNLAPAHGESNGSPSSFIPTVATLQLRMLFPIYVQTFREAHHAKRSWNSYLHSHPLSPLFCILCTCRPYLNFLRVSLSNFGNPSVALRGFPASPPMRSPLSSR